MYILFLNLLNKYLTAFLLISRRAKGEKSCPDGWSEDGWSRERAHSSPTRLRMSSDDLAQFLPFSYQKVCDGCWAPFGGLLSNTYMRLRAIKACIEPYIHWTKTRYKRMLPSTLPIFPSSHLPPFHPSILPIFHPSIHSLSLFFLCCWIQGMNLHSPFKFGDGRILLGQIYDQI